MNTQSNTIIISVYDDTCSGLYYESNDSKAIVKRVARLLLNESDFSISKAGLVLNVSTPSDFSLAEICELFGIEK